MPADPTLKLSDLAGPDAAGWSDVAVFVRADGDGEPFVVLLQRPEWESTYIHKISSDSPYWAEWHGKTVRHLGRGRLIPARIVMEGEVDLAAQVATLREALEQYANPGFYGFLLDPVGRQCDPTKKARAALAATAPTPTEGRQ